MKKSLKTVADAKQVQDLQRKLAVLKREIKAKDRAHGETLQALENARATPHRRLGRLPKKPPITRNVLREVITGDWHGNKHDPKAWAAFIGDLQAIQPHRITLGGDIIDCGGFLAEHHTLGYVAESTDSYEEDVVASNHLLDQVQAVCPHAEIHYLEGNHEHRVERWIVNATHRQNDFNYLRKTFSPEFTLHLQKRGITYYRYGEFHGTNLPPGWIKWHKLHYVHKLSNSRHAAAKAVDDTAGNVVLFDTHRSSSELGTRPGVGLIGGWNCPCLCMLQPHYANTRPTKQSHGYMVRYIDQDTSDFAMMPVAIDQGKSLGTIIFNPHE